MALTPSLSAEVNVPIESERDIVIARQRGRELARMLGFSSTDQALLATAISEVARNIVIYAQKGTVLLRGLDEGGRRGLLISAEDHGPGIEDPAAAMRDGYSTGTGLGLGLPGAKRLVDEFELESKCGVGTTVTMKKWSQ
ncbi:MAG TPA: anti-sigma regulatory factor [Polyangiaceae bacterium]